MSNVSSNISLSKSEYSIKLKNVSKVYKMGKEKIYALNNINLDFKRGRVYCLLGKSGSGKSTLLNIIAGLEKPTTGEIVVNGENVEKMDEKNLALFRQKYIGFVFQSYNLLPTLTAIENVAIPLVFRKVKRAERDKKALAMLENVGLLNRTKHKPSEMSGGQQQRVSIARAFINNPDVIFADEPTGNLDTKTTNEMIDLMIKLCKEENRTLIIVTHNLELADYCDEIIYIRDGNIEKLEVNENPIKAMTLSDNNSNNNNNEQ